MYLHLKVPIRRYFKACIEMWVAQKHANSRIFQRGLQSGYIGDGQPARRSEGLAFNEGTINRLAFGLASSPLIRCTGKTFAAGVGCALQPSRVIVKTVGRLEEGRVEPLSAAPSIGSPPG